ncbi:2-hydroxyacid dehydrogenase [uncultured Pseudacidovorax sp.]|uniref:2-hydroxyacid dehydrogenase n=1 Tax=uncultured Pseudacidovorax sp. TaxID=679313 RepID=UPI0025E6A4E6|nr:2-hydroxyacid dehydrogenase [uncultured Pseudacidovorax sp.]
MTLDTRPRILQNGALLPQLEQALAATYRLTRLQAQPDPAAFLAAEGAQFDGIACTARIGAPRALIDALPSLRVISNFGVGFETIDVERARERGIAVGYTPDVLNDCVADTAFGLVMDVARGFSAADRFTRRGDWLRGQFPLSRRVSGKRLGIVGLGRIGRVIARRASGFDMEVRYHNRRPVDDVPYGYESTLEGLARWADFLVVASAGGPATRGLISAAVLDALGPQGFLVNVSRGTVVDQAALVRALQQGRIAGAGLDVFEQEPQVPEALFAMDNVVLLPHVASNTHETRQAMADLVMDNLASYFATGRVRVPVPGSA